MENKECTEQEMYDDLWKEIAEAEKIEMEKQNKIKDDFKEQLKGLINVKRLWEELDDNDGWMPEKIVEIKLTDEKSSGYPSYQIPIRIKYNFSWILSGKNIASLKTCNDMELNKTYSKNGVWDYHLVLILNFIIIKY